MEHLTRKLFINAGILATALTVYSCKTPESSKPRSWSDAITTEHLEGDTFLVQCPNGSSEIVTRDDLSESDGEKVCIAGRKIFTIAKTYLKSENLNQPGGCEIPANTVIRLAAPLRYPQFASKADCTLYSPDILQACRNFSATILKADLSKLKSITGEPCQIVTGKLEGPMATKEDQKFYEKILLEKKNDGSSGDLRQIPAKFIYTDSQLGYPRSASYPSYPQVNAR